MTFAVRNIKTGETVYIRDKDSLSAIRKAADFIAGAKEAKIEERSNFYYFEHGNSIFCVCKNEVVL